MASGFKIIWTSFYVILITVVTSSYNAGTSTAKIEGPSQLFLADKLQFTLTCFVSNPAGKISWLRNDKRLNETLMINEVRITEKTSSRGKTSIITIADSKYGGVYTCVPQNGLPDSVTIHGGSAKIRATIEGGYRISFRETSTATLVCRFNVGPIEAEGVTWFKGGVELDLHSTREYRFETELLHYQLETKLIIPDVNVNDRGKYTCAPMRGDSDSIILRVLSQYSYGNPNLEDYLMYASAGGQLTTEPKILLTVFFFFTMNFYRYFQLRPT